MLYPKSDKYRTPELMSKIMGPNPLMLLEEALTGLVDHVIPTGSLVCDLGSGQGLTSVFLAKEYGFAVYATDLWSDPEENAAFFATEGVVDRVIPVKADATDLPFSHDFFDAVISTDSYNYFGRDPHYLDDKLLPFVKEGGLVVITVPGMKRDLHDRLPQALLASWTPEELDYIHDAAYWAEMVGACEGAEVLAVEQMETNEAAWADWVALDNEYAVKDRRSVEAGACEYLNFVKIVLRKRSGSNS